MTCFFSYSKPPHVGPPGTIRELRGALSGSAVTDSVPADGSDPDPVEVSCADVWLPSAAVVEPAKTRTQVLIIGAGIAGLAAARDLTINGYDVLVLEARNRIGGRIWTSDEMGVPVDMGSAWIFGGSGNPLLQIAAKRGLQTLSPGSALGGVKTSLPSVVYDQTGRRLAPAEMQMLADLRADFVGYVKQCQQRGADISFQDAEDEFAAIKNLDARQHCWLRFVVRTYIEHEWAGSREESSLLEYDKAFHGMRHGHSFPLGQGQLITDLVRGIAIRTGCEVRHIDYSGDNGVDLLTSNGVFNAPHVLVTVPLGVLKSEKILFQPELPLTKRKAIAGLRMGVFNKVLLRFDRVFWDQKCERVGLLSSSLWDWPEIIPLQDVTGAPVLMAFSAGRQALCNEAMGAEDVVASLMASLRKIYGAGIPEPIAHQVSRWHADPFSLGSYSFVPIGSANTLRSFLAAPVSDRLFFAGEATSQPFPSTVHGAFLSGIRAAAEIMACKIVSGAQQLRSAVE